VNLYKSVLAVAISLAFTGCTSMSDKDSQSSPNERGFSHERLAFTSTDVGDDDRDGIINGRDNCPDTATGIQVDKKGCEIALTDTNIDSRKFAVAKDGSLSAADSTALGEFLETHTQALAGGDVAILIDAKVVEKGYVSFAKSARLSYNFAEVLVRNYGVDPHDLKVLAERYSKGERPKAESDMHEVELIVTNRRADDQVRWNIWSVELEDSLTANKTQRFINFDNAREL